MMRNVTDIIHIYRIGKKNTRCGYKGHVWALGLWIFQENLHGHGDGEEDLVFIEKEDKEL